MYRSRRRRARAEEAGHLAGHVRDKIVWNRKSISGRPPLVSSTLVREHRQEIDGMSGSKDFVVLALSWRPTQSPRAQIASKERGRAPEVLLLSSWFPPFLPFLLTCPSTASHRINVDLDVYQFSGRGICVFDIPPAVTILTRHIYISPYPDFPAPARNQIQNRMSDSSSDLISAFTFALPCIANFFALSAFSTVTAVHPSRTKQQHTGGFSDFGHAVASDSLGPERFGSDLEAFHRHIEFLSRYFAANKNTRPL